MSQPFQSVGALRPGRSVFNLSHEKKFDCNMGSLIPVMFMEMVPGDVFEFGNNALLRFQPLVAPVLHEINVYAHYYFCPTRVLWPTVKAGNPLVITDGWEGFITGGPTGALAFTIPTWDPTTYTKGSLWDYLGLPAGIKPDAANYPHDFARRMYNMTYNEWYRDQTLQSEVALTNEAILQRNWEKDYFTSALPWQQRGTAPALPISGTTSAVWADTVFGAFNPLANHAWGGSSTGAAAEPYMLTGTDADSLAAAKAMFAANTVDLSSATTFDVADLRLAFQIQKWMERNARSGARYVEFLTAHFGVSPSDDRMQRPEYIGGSRTPCIVSEVLQTSETDGTPQGTMAGHGIAVSDSYAGKFRAPEFGYVMCIMSVMPRPSYQDGIDRQWLRRTKYDFYFPEFANLSEQAITNAEVCVTTDATHNAGLFGYQGRYDELRYQKNMVCNNMRDTLDYWHLGRQFDPTTPGVTTPSLNSAFLTCAVADTTRIFAVPAEPGLLINWGNSIKAVRPVPASPEPGLIDHN